MLYYFVWVRSSRYHSSEPLTYSSPKRVERGAVVQVELQKELVMGLVIGGASEPRFKTKPIVRLYDLPPLPLHLLRLSQWLQAYYPAPLGIIGQQFLPVNLSEKQLLKPPPEHLPEPDLSGLPALTEEQQNALAAMEESNTYLLHGATGSGKTRLYIELAARAIGSGKSALILTPEISLTAQLAANFRAVFGERVLIMHSNQAPGERQAAWLACLRSTEPLIIVGPRSAIFSPLAKLGLVVLDEAHEAAYKQEQAPQYQTGRVAAWLANAAHAMLVLGSATPSVSDYYVASHKQKPIIRLSRLAQASKTPDTKLTLIDRGQLDLFSRSPYLSQPLIQAIEGALERHEQSLLYLNRRGTARLVLCENCGWQASCPHCDVPLTYHGDSHQLRCHSCNYHTAVSGSCPTCGHPGVLFKTAGTKAIVEEVERLFPHARVVRFDTDNTKAERFEQHYQAIREGQADILVGTQLLAKGLDLPLLSTLGVLLADTSLYLPDFSAQERTYQLITQVIGRIGRGHVAGQAIIQTYHPDHPVLQAALADDYQGFYETELAQRRQYYFPPFCHLLKLSVRRASSQAAETAAAQLKAALEAERFRVKIEGPAPCFYERFQNKYQWQLVIKATERSELLRVINYLPANWSYNLDPLDLL